MPLNQVLDISDIINDGASKEGSSSKTCKRQLCDSPTPSLQSESSTISTQPRHKRPKFQRRVSFDVDQNDNLNTRLSTFDKYEGDVADNIWWSKCDLKKIMKREGRLVLNLKIDASRNGEASCIANSLKQSINETFKKCVEKPMAVNQDTPAIFEFIKDEEPSVATTTTTRGLERYIAPIMGAHREMVVKSLLNTQGQLSDSDPSYRMQVLGSRYEHLSKIATNFAIVMGQCDAKLADASYCA